VVDTPPSPEVAAQIEAGRQKLDAMTSKQQSNDTPDGRAPHRMSEAAKSAKAAMNAPPLVKEVNPAASPAEQAITRLRNDPAFFNKETENQRRRWKRARARRRRKRMRLGARMGGVNDWR
jgi:hypothetical protein